MCMTNEPGVARGFNQQIAVSSYTRDEEVSGASVPRSGMAPALSNVVIEPHHLDRVQEICDNPRPFGPVERLNMSQWNQSYTRYPSKFFLEVLSVGEVE